MELNINCDLGEKSEIFVAKNDYDLLKVINTANVACGYHAGSKEIIKETIINSKKFNVSVGAHPGFKDRENFGRKRYNLSSKDLEKLIIEQLEIIKEVAEAENYDVTHVKPHGALNNMACEDFNISYQIGKSIYSFDKNLIFMVLPRTEMIKAAQKLNMKYACEIFADRNYNENGLLIDRSKKHSMIDDPTIVIENILQMLEKKSIKTYQGNFLEAEIDTICIHGDGDKALDIARSIKQGLINNGIVLKQLDKLYKFK